ncbi:MAG: dihydroorotase, partial [Porticoccaceae bacterium]
LYAEVFEQAGALDKLEAFASTNGPDFYGLPYNPVTIELKKQPWQLPDSVPFEDTQVIPLGAGTTLNWKLVE